MWMIKSDLNEFYCGINKIGNYLFYSHKSKAILFKSRREAEHIANRIKIPGLTVEEYKD